MGLLPVPGRSHVIPMAVLTTIALLLLLPSMACSATPTESDESLAPPAQGDLVARLPADSTTIGYVDFAALRQSPLYEFVKAKGAAFGDPDELEQMVGKTGINPQTDLHRLAFMSHSPVARPNADTSGVLLMASFDRDKVLEALAELPTTQYRDHTIYELANWHRDEGDDDDAVEASPDDDDDAAEAPESESVHHGYLTIMDDSTLAFGGDQAIREIVDVAIDAPSARSNKQLMQLLEDVDPGSEVWMVSAQKALLSKIEAPEGGAMPQIPMDRIDALIVSARLADGVALKIRGRTAEEDDAKLLGDSLNGMLAFGKMMLQSRNPQVFEILDRGITAGSNGRDVRISAELSMNDIEALYGFAESEMKTSADDTEA